MHLTVPAVDIGDIKEFSRTVVKLTRASTQTITQLDVSSEAC